MEFTLKKTLNGNYRVLVDGKVHPLLCGLEDGWSARQRIKKVFGIQDDDFKIEQHRFEIGHEYLFITEKFIPKTERFGNLYLPWCDQLISINAVVLRCVSQHAVPGEWDDEIKYKGYKFELVRTNVPFLKNETHVTWHNQFPRASYGQLSTDADFYAHPHVTSEEDIKRYLDSEIGRGFYGHFELMDTKFSALSRGIRNFKELITKADKGELPAHETRTKADFEYAIAGIEKYVADLTEFSKEHGFRVVREPFYMRNTTTGEKGFLAGFEDIDLYPL